MVAYLSIDRSCIECEKFILIVIDRLACLLLGQFRIGVYETQEQ